MLLSLDLCLPSTRTSSGIIFNEKVNFSNNFGRPIDLGLEIQLAANFVFAKMLSMVTDKCHGI